MTVTKYNVTESGNISWQVGCTTHLCDTWCHAASG